MSEKPKIPFRDAMAVAHALTETLRPFCHRIQIAGSLRRKKPFVGDIEILFVPRFEERQADMFSTLPVDIAGEEIDFMLARREIEKRPNVKGIFTWGEANKYARHIASGIPVDFFTTTAAAWWVALAIRTGSKETNLRLTMGANKLGRTLHAYGDGVSSNRGGPSIQATSEEMVFALCGVKYLPPDER